jgi:hypothetical protein
MTDTHKTFISLATGPDDPDLPALPADMIPSKSRAKTGQKRKPRA